MAWTKKLPSMPTKRSETTAVCTGSMLLVAGGRGKGGRVLLTVEVMTTENHQWSTAADLPQPIYGASATTCGDQLYNIMLGGTNEEISALKSVFTCSVSTIIRSTTGIQSSKDKAGVWKQIADLPVTDSTCEYFHGQLLAIGGHDSGKNTTAIHMYCSATNSWEIISHMKTACCNCFTAVLSDSQLMIFGGYIHGLSTTDMVEITRVSKRYLTCQ